MAPSSCHRVSSCKWQKSECGPQETRAPLALTGVSETRDVGPCCPLKAQGICVTLLKVGQVPGSRAPWMSLFESSLHQRGQDSLSVLQKETGTCPRHLAREGGSRMSIIQDKNQKQARSCACLVIPHPPPRAIVNSCFLSWIPPSP